MSEKFSQENATKEKHPEPPKERSTPEFCRNLLPKKLGQQSAEIHAISTPPAGCPLGTGIFLPEKSFPGQPTFEFSQKPVQTPPPLKTILRNPMGNLHGEAPPPPLEGKPLLNSATENAKKTAEMPWPPPLFEEFSTEVGCGNPGHKNGGAQGKLSSRDKGQLEEKVPPPVSPGGAETEKLIRPTPHLPGPEPAGGSCDMVAEVVLGEEGTGPILVKNSYFNPDSHLTPDAFSPPPPGRGGGDTNVPHGGHSPVNPH